MSWERLRWWLSDIFYDFGPAAAVLVVAVILLG